MTDTKNTQPPLPAAHLHVSKGGTKSLVYTIDDMYKYGNARAAYAVAQMQGKPADIVATLQEVKATASKRHPLHAAAAPAREVTDAEIDALLFDAIGFELETEQWMNRSDLHQIVRAAIALANGRDGA